MGDLAREREGSSDSSERSIYTRISVIGAVNGDIVDFLITRDMFDDHGELDVTSPCAHRCRTWTCVRAGEAPATPWTHGPESGGRGERLNGRHSHATACHVLYCVPHRVQMDVRGAIDARLACRQR